MQAQLQAFDKKILKTKNSTAQYIAMQKKNFAALRREKMKKPQKRASKIISGHSSVLRSTLQDLKTFYGDPTASRAQLRPAVLSELSICLEGELAPSYQLVVVPSEEDTESVGSSLPSTMPRV